MGSADCRRERPRRTAVMMAITHSIAHSYPGPPSPANKMLDFVNYHLTTRYTSNLGSFVTAFYGIYDSAKRLLTYACAGHNPPRLKRLADGTISSTRRRRRTSLGVLRARTYRKCTRLFDLVTRLFSTPMGSPRLETPWPALRAEATDLAITDWSPNAEELIKMFLEVTFESLERLAHRGKDDERRQWPDNVDGV